MTTTLTVDDEARALRMVLAGIEDDTAAYLSVLGEATSANRLTQTYTSAPALATRIARFALPDLATQLRAIVTATPSDAPGLGPRLVIPIDNGETQHLISAQALTLRLVLAWAENDICAVDAAVATAAQMLVLPNLRTDLTYLAAQLCRVSLADPAGTMRGALLDLAGGVHQPAEPFGWLTFAPGQAS